MTHPYKKFEGTELWNSINRGLDDLVENKHLEETTPREYIVGHLCQIIDGSYDNECCGE